MKKGFTLIELLAVIVILAIIAIIAVPIVLNIIESSRRNSKLVSARIYTKVVNNAIAVSKMKNDFNLPDGMYSINSSGNVCLNSECTEVLKVEFNGERPTSGQIKMERTSAVCVYDLQFTNYAVTCDSNGQYVLTNNSGNQHGDDSSEPVYCTYQDLDSSGSITFGDKVSCPLEQKTDSFYVIAGPTNGVVTMLSEWNLNIKQDGNANSVLYSGAPTGYQDEHIRGSSHGGGGTYGTIHFSTENMPTNPQSNEYVFDSSSLLSTYVYAYAGLINTALGDIYASGRLIRYDELIALNCYANDFCSGPSWVIQTNYWSGSAQDSSYMWVVADGFLGGTRRTSDGYGIRPVIEISSEAIQLAS